MKTILILERTLPFTDELGTHGCDLEISPLLGRLRLLEERSAIFDWSVGLRLEGNGREGIRAEEFQEKNQTVPAMTFRFTIFGILTVHAGLLLYGALIHSPTLDETAHLPAGLAIWRLRRFDVYPHNPPLVKAMAAVPVLFAGPTEDWRGIDDSPLDRPEFNLGAQFVDANGPDSFWLYSIARWACAPLSLLGGWICFRWARELYGGKAGLAALCLWCFSPHALANGQLITPDVGAAALGVAACYFYWRWLRRPGWTTAAAAGVALGLAELAKFTWIVLFVVWPILWMIRRRQESPPVRQMAAILFIGLYVINAGYLFQGTFRPLGKYRFHSESLGGGLATGSSGGEGGNRFIGTCLERLPIPLPASYAAGIDLQKRDFERGYRSYLRGEWKQGGWWYYYLYGIAVKSTLGEWLLIIAVVMRRLRGAGKFHCGCDERILLWPAVVVLAIVSSQDGFSHHVRYALPAVPFVYVWLAQLAGATSSRTRTVAWGAILVSAASSLSIYPHSGSYFNELAGGPLGGPKRLVDSNVSWGQDLLLLKNWLDDRPQVRPLQLAYFGNLDPRAAGIEFTPPPRLPSRPNASCQEAESWNSLLPGWYAVDASIVYGLNCRIPDGRGGWSYPTSAECDYQYFQWFQPVARAGYSIYIYRLTADDIARVRRNACDRHCVAKFLGRGELRMNVSTGCGGTLYCS